jgi:alpha-L-arabinofuranosidase
MTFVNPRAGESVQVKCEIPQATMLNCRARILHHADMNAFNSFSRPEVVIPKPFDVDLSAREISMTLPELSVVTAEFSIKV